MQNANNSDFALPHDRVLQSLTHTGPGSAAISSFGYGYDAAGNITSWTQSQASNRVLPVTAWTMAMDGSDELTGVAVAGHTDLSQGFVYDNAGNRLSRTVAGQQVSKASYNSLNQIESLGGGGKMRMAGTVDEPARVTVQGQAAKMLSATNFVAFPDVAVGTNTISVVATDGNNLSTTNRYSVVVPTVSPRSFRYDAAGNLANDGVRAHEWDGLNRMVKVVQGADVYEFAYDGFNRRVSEKKNGALTKQFVWDGLSLAEERDASNAVTKRFFPQGEQNIANSLITNLYYSKDHLGSVREVTDSTGAIVASYSYDAWGNRTKLTAGADLATFGYTGHYTHSGTGLVFAPFRVYDPETGRWPSKDPIGEAGGINLYGYVGNNPVNLWDPWGLLTAVVIGGQRSDSWNVFGHASVATTGAGLRSPGTTEYPFGSSFTDFINDQSSVRDQDVYILNTTPEQEKAINDYLDSKGSRVGKIDNCSSRIANALDYAGVKLPSVDSDLYPGTTPGSLRMSLTVAESNGDALHIRIPQGSTLRNGIFSSYNPK